jgi:hypothetical protein
MNVSQPEAGKKYYTPDEANRTLPLVRAIVEDITRLHASLSSRVDQLQELDEEYIAASRREELEALQDEFEKDQERLRDYIEELQKLGVEFKGFELGLVDFPCWKDGREIYLCWKVGEPSVSHWHEVAAGFAGRKPIRA